MGCGQSHIAVIYPRKAKAKSTGSGGSEESEEDCGEGAEEGASGEHMSGTVPSSAAQSSQPSQSNAQHDDDPNKMRQMVNISNSPLLQQAELSSSQYDFFKMLDDKINNGPDYQPNCEFELTLEESRLCRLLDEWQMAKQKAAWGFQVRQQAVGQQPVRKQLQRYHSLQSNGDIRHKQHFYPIQLQQYPPQQYPPPQQYAPQQYPQAPQYTQQYPHYPQQYPPVGQTGQYPPFLQLSNSLGLICGENVIPGRSGQAPEDYLLEYSQGPVDLFCTDPKYYMIEF